MLVFAPGVRAAFWRRREDHHEYPSRRSALDTLFRAARTHHAWLDRPVSDETLKELYDLLKWGPTSANTGPARFVFLGTRDGKERLRPALAVANVDKVMTAPVTAIIAYDLRFFDWLPKLFPHDPAMRARFAETPEIVEVTARRNCSLQGAYFMLAARALGLDWRPAALTASPPAAGSRPSRMRTVVVEL